MEFKEKVMYHFHQRGIHDELWVPGNTFVFDGTKRNAMWNEAKLINENDSLVEQKIIYYKMVYKDKLDAYLIREMMLELYRKRNCPDQISRLSCLYFCDLDSLLYWNTFFTKGYDLYKVMLDGEYFKSSSRLLPVMNAVHTFDEFERLAKRYWNPKMYDCNLNNSAEYIFKGKVRVLSKTNINDIIKK